jgi:hypothetical protein
MPCRLADAATAASNRRLLLAQVPHSGCGAWGGGRRVTGAHGPCLLLLSRQAPEGRRCRPALPHLLCHAGNWHRSVQGRPATPAPAPGGGALGRAVLTSVASCSGSPPGPRRYSAPPTRPARSPLTATYQRPSGSCSRWMVLPCTWPNATSCANLHRRAGRPSAGRRPVHEFQQVFYWGEGGARTAARSAPPPSPPPLLPPPTPNNASTAAGRPPAQVHLVPCAPLRVVQAQVPGGVVRQHAGRQRGVAGEVGADGQDGGAGVGVCPAVGAAAKPAATQAGPRPIQQAGSPSSCAAAAAAQQPSGKQRPWHG